MERFSLSYSQLIEEVELYPRRYGELLALGIIRKEDEQAASGNLPIDDNLSNDDLEARAVHNRMNQSASNINYAKQKLAEAGIK